MSDSNGVDFPFQPTQVDIKVIGPTPDGGFVMVCQTAYGTNAYFLTPSDWENFKAAGDQIAGKRHILIAREVPT